MHQISRFTQSSRFFCFCFFNVWIYKSGNASQKEGREKTRATTKMKGGPTVSWSRARSSFTSCEFGRLRRAQEKGDWASLLTCFIHSLFFKLLKGYRDSVCKLNLFQQLCIMPKGSIRINTICELFDQALNFQIVLCPVRSTS